jgi:hypothetical protein
MDPPQGGSSSAAMLSDNQARAVLDSALRSGQLGPQLTAAVSLLFRHLGPMENMDTTSGGPGPSNVQPSLNPSAPGSAVAQSGSGQAQGASGSGPSVVQAVVPSNVSQVANVPGAPVANVPAVVVASGADPALSGGASRVPTERDMVT